MKTREEKKQRKEIYQRLRSLSWEALWEDEVERFNKATPDEREEQVAVVRAVGVVFAESGDPAEKPAVTAWLTELLRDPSEKIRRYAMAALPKIGGGEAEVLGVLRETKIDREKEFAAKALEKIGGAAALHGGVELPVRAQQKIKAALARGADPSAIHPQGILSGFARLRIYLRGAHGLESLVTEETREFAARTGKFRVCESGPGWVEIEPMAPFSLSELFQLRCFGTIGFRVGRGRSSDELAQVISSELARNIFGAFTKGAIRYRLNFADQGHQRGAVHALAERIYARCPEILNDARSVTWTVDIGREGEVELRPNLTPDPRFYYRLRDVPAASHPQIAAGLARLAGKAERDAVWDPFCGSGMELIERSLLGGVTELHGTDLSESALAITRENVAAAGLEKIKAHFIHADFRDYGKKLPAGSVGLVITNPPLGMRVPVPNLRELIQDLFDTSARVLRKGGRLVLANPTTKQVVPPGLKLALRYQVDFGGFNCWIEKYIKQ